MVEYIKEGDKLLSIIIKSSYVKDGIDFFTPDDFSQQLGYMNRPKGYVIPPHVHNPVAREITWTQEVLFIKSGIVRVDFYNDSKDYLKSSILQKGDVILLAAGGHGFTMLENAEIIEVKQGPYCGERDKTRFETIKEEKVKLNE